MKTEKCNHELIAIGEDCYKCNKCGEVYVPFHSSIISAISKFVDIKEEDVKIKYVNTLTYESDKECDSADVYSDGEVLCRKDKKVIIGFSFIIVIYRNDKDKIKNIELVINSSKLVKQVILKVAKYINFIYN
jgi:hypothetical protein